MYLGEKEYLLSVKKIYFMRQISEHVWDRSLLRESRDVNSFAYAIGRIAVPMPVEWYRESISNSISCGGDSSTTSKIVVDGPHYIIASNT